MYVKRNHLSYEEVSAVFGYDPQTGKLTWRVNPNRRLKAGDEAGVVKLLRTAKRSGRKFHYRYVTYKGVEMPAARLVWMLCYKEWPPGNVKFKDGDTLNLRQDNLVLGAFLSVSEMRDGRRHHRMTSEAMRHYALKRYYGLSGEQYGEMLAAQKGLCAICGKPETAMFKGKPKVMHVDHCHDTDQVRELLCGNCNAMLGHAKDSPETLRAAAAYLEKHGDRLNNVISLSGQRPNDKEVT